MLASDVCRDLVALHRCLPAMLCLSFGGLEHALSCPEPALLGSICISLMVVVNRSREQFATS